MVVRAVSVMFLSVYLMAGNHLTVSAANGEKISEDSDFSVSGENMDSLLNSLDLSRIEAFLREAGGSTVPGLSFREILSMLLSGNYQSVVRMLMDFCRTALFREISEKWQMDGAGHPSGNFRSGVRQLFESLCRQSGIGDGLLCHVSSDFYTACRQFFEWGADHADTVGAAL